ncbi:hypothetical protein Tco_1208292, partial [Tanacetum coccineum]
ERISKSKSAKTSKNQQEMKRQETEETSDQEKKVNEDPIEVKGSIMTSLQSLRAHLDVLKAKGPKVSKLERWFIKGEKEISTTRTRNGNPQQDLEEKGVIDSGCSRHMTQNMSYLTDFEEINKGYVAFGGNPKGGKITGRGTIKTVPRKNNMYSVDLKNNIPKGGLTCLFAKATSDESNL